MPRNRLPVLFGAALALEFWAELAFAVPAGTPHRPLAALPLALAACAAIGGLFTVAISLVAPVIVGRLLRSRAALNCALREQTALLERRAQDAAGRAVADERTRIARELHDVVAHALSAMTVQATGARRLALARPEQARAAFGAIEAAGREALDELRRLLGVLRRGDAELTLAPQPSLRHVRSLARRTSASGLPVTLAVAGDERELPAGVDATAYRVIQDALAAARDVGGADRAQVRLRYGASTLEVVVRDDGPAAGARPLLGVRERVTLHGGRFAAGPGRPTPGHVIRATLPLDGAPVPQDEPADAPCELAGRRDRALAYTLPFAWRRRAPVRAALAVSAATLAMGLALTPLQNLFVPYVVMLALAYAAGAHRDGLAAYAALALIVAALPAVVATFDVHHGVDFALSPAVAVVAWLAGRIVRGRTRLSAELHETAARVAEADEDARHQAATDERRRIARELHDLIAHSMSVMVVQAGGARRILHRDPARALEAAARIERTGRDALGEMRHLLGLLNGAGRAPALAPQPTLAEIGELVASSRAAGLPTALEVRGERRELPAGLDLTAYRIVQECLTNALKHAGRAATTVTVDWSRGDALTLEVRDRGELAPLHGRGGHGIVGMRERVKLYGGELEAGPAQGGGWRVRATLPLVIDSELSAA